MVLKALWAKPHGDFEVLQNFHVCLSVYNVDVHIEEDLDLTAVASRLFLTIENASSTAGTPGQWNTEYD